MPEKLPPNTEFLTVPDLAERWETTPSKIRRLIEDSYLAAIYIDGTLRIPAEFAGDYEPLPALRGTLLALHDAGYKNDEAIVWMLSENDELDSSPIAALRAGQKSAVRRATQSLAF